MSATDATARQTAAPKDNADGLSELLDDAQMVALFGQRTGQLSDGALQDSIAAVRRKPDPKWSDEEVTKLQGALNQAVKSIRPVTLLDLRSGWNPFYRSFQSWAFLSAKNLAFILFAFFLIVAASVATFVLNSGNLIVQALEDLQKVEPQRRIGDLQRQLLNAQPTNNSNSSPEILLAQDAYFDTLDDLRDIDKNLLLYIPLADQYEREYRNPLLLARNMMGWDWSGERQGSQDRSGMSAYQPYQPPASASQSPPTIQPQPLAAASNVSENPTSAASLSASTPAPNDGGQNPPLTPPPQQNGGTYSLATATCALANAMRGGLDSPFGASEVGKMLARYQLGGLELSCYQGLSYQPGMVPSISEKLSRMNQVINLYALWILPAIYGALGATIFFMRSVLDPLLPDPGLSKILLRVALGALAGVILGWFWTPETTLGGEVSKIGFSLFAMSFLFGFSIDVFFAMLDRFVRFGRDFFEQVGAAKTQPVS